MHEAGGGDIWGLGETNTGDLKQYGCYRLNLKALWVKLAKRRPQSYGKEAAEMLKIKLGRIIKCFVERMSRKAQLSHKYHGHIFDHGGLFGINEQEMWHLLRTIFSGGFIHIQRTATELLTQTNKQKKKLHPALMHTKCACSFGGICSKSGPKTGKC